MASEQQQRQLTMDW